MIFHLVRMVLTLPFHPAFTLVKAEVSALLPSPAGSALFRSFSSQIHEAQALTAPPLGHLLLSPQKPIQHASPSTRLQDVIQNT